MGVGGAAVVPFLRSRLCTILRHPCNNCWTGLLAVPLACMRRPQGTMAVTQPACLPSPSPSSMPICATATPRVTAACQILHGHPHTALYGKSCRSQSMNLRVCPSRDCAVLVQCSGVLAQKILSWLPTASTASLVHSGSTDLAVWLLYIHRRHPWCTLVPLVWQCGCWHPPQRFYAAHIAALISVGAQ